MFLWDDSQFKHVFWKMTNKGEQKREFNFKLSFLFSLDCCNIFFQVPLMQVVSQRRRYSFNRGIKYSSGSMNWAGGLMRKMKKLLWDSLNLVSPTQNTSVHYNVWTLHVCTVKQWTRVNGTTDLLGPKMVGPIKRNPLYNLLFHLSWHFGPVNFPSCLQSHPIHETELGLSWGAD